MQNVTRPDDLNKYYLYKGVFVTREWHNGYYFTFFNGRHFAADTQRGMKNLINGEMTKAEKRTAGA